MKKVIKNIFKIFLLLVAAGIIFIAWANYSIRKESSPFVSYNISDVPETKVGLLLGTGKNLNNGMPNAYFYNRIQAAIDLYKSGKIKYIIVSGDNSTKEYNEPEDMQLTLMKYGIPKDRIIMDHAGFRTLDSVVRAKDIFGQKKLVIISQKFHNERAVFLAKKNGIEAFGYNANDVNKYAGLKTNLREYLAKTKVYWDLLFGVQPKFRGEKIQIP
ncbi:vancomycin high temperature exclusion protein [Chryseobacterium oranimense G311]|uniref:SanA/YdcF family protein n=1 Tax=Chryseobacterium oranimense TaxID=421058 RepID=UPI0005339239|nr:ElyC/SanA/YdcF family protein [Chryseobacterium oranimense]CEJ71853.1 vancomycin high temperature exclusion protein [Chryseobacterium oranimense G311]